MNLINLLPSSIKEKIYSKSERSQDVIINIFLSLAMKGATILSSLLIVPLTINYVNPNQYGIWLTLSSIIGWVVFFDLGLGNGFRNKFAEAKAQNNILLARELLSTTYFAIGVIVLFVNIIAIIANFYIDWTDILKVSPTYKDELQKIFFIVCTFTCINMVANVFTSLLSADQKNGYASVITAIGQYISLITIYILTLTTKGSLLNLAIFYSGIPCIVMIIASIFMFNFSSYKKYKPSLKLIKISHFRNILQLGSQFFIIYLCLIVIFQVINIVISREIGPIGVTQYNIANKYFNIIYMIITIITAPLWSAFTDAYTKKDYQWMKSMVCKIEKCWYISIFIGVLMLILSPFFYQFWIGESVPMPIAISISMLFLIIFQSFGSIYMQMINGIGKIRIQLIAYILFAIIAWPLFTISGQYLGLSGIIAIPAFVYLTQGVLGKIQLEKIIKQKDRGLWSK